MEQIIISIITGYLIILSLIGFVQMGIDKHKSMKKAWRIPEKTLLLVAFIGGGIGSFLGMYIFRHKTKHTKFIILFPLAAAIYILLLIKLYNII